MAQEYLKKTKKVEEPQKTEFEIMVNKVKEKLTKTEKTDRNGNIVKEIINVTVDNYEKILLYDDRYKNVIKYNDFAERLEVIGAKWNNRQHYIDDSDRSKMLSVIEKTYNIYNERKFDHAIENMARKKYYNPIKDILRPLLWDGVDRISTMFHDTLGAEKNDYNADVAKLMLLGAISRLYNPGCKFDYCVILSSENTQGLGKSSLIRKLALNDKYFTDSLRDFNNKDSFQLLRGKWLVELGELKALNQTNGGVEAVKQFLSALFDTYRDSYGHFSKDYERKCIFIGTTNRGEFLIDDTGNRRFLPVICATKEDKQAMKRIKYHMYEDTDEIKNYVLQLWAQAMYIFNSNEYSLVLDNKHNDYLEELHKNARVYNPMIDEIQNYINSLDNYEYISIKSVYIDVYNNGIEVKDMPREKRNEIRSILNSSDITNIEKMGQTSVRTKYGVAKGYRVVKDFEPITQTQEKEIKESFKQSNLDL